MSFLPSRIFRFASGPGLIFSLGILAVFPGASPAGLEDIPEYQTARTALADHLYGLAAGKLERLLNSEANLTEAEKDTLRLAAAEANLRDRKPEAALALLDRPSPAGSTAAAFWRGSALAAAGRLNEALDALQPAAADASFVHHAEAVLTRANLLHTLGDSDTALAELTAFSEAAASPDTAVRARIRAAEIEISRGHLESAARLLQASAPAPDAPPLPATAAMELKLASARLALAKNDARTAASLFRELIETDDKSPIALRQRAIIGEAGAWGQLGEKPRASKTLTDFIESNPSSPLLELAFRSLETLELLSEPPVLAQTETWAADGSTPARQALAVFYRGVAETRAGGLDEASEIFARFLREFPNHSLTVPAGMRQLDLLVRAGNNARVLEIIPNLRKRTANAGVIAYLDSLEARTRFKEGDLAGAAARFDQAAAAQPDADAKNAELFNAALVAVAEGDRELADQFARQLAQAPESGLAADFLLERGLFHAAHSQPDAFEELDEFIRRFPDHERATDAEIALAEMYLNQVPAQPVAAREHLLRARTKALTLAQQEKLEYVAIWTEAAASASDATTEKATRFLDHWPRSPRRASVFMLLGETYFRLQDYPNAVTFFERLAVESPDSPMAEPALFFAAKAASLTLSPENLRRAIEIWAQVVQRDGPLAPAARHEQGLLKLSLDEPDDAIAAFDSILSMDSAAPELRIAATCDKGQALYLKATRGAIDPGALEAAIEAFQSVETNKDASRAWRFQATVRRGRCLEVLGRTDEALERYYDVVVRGAPNAPLASIPVEEFDWYFRAGTAAVKLLEKKEKWEGAVKIAERLAGAGGPRAAEAERIADRLRLRHFIWEGPLE